MSDAIEEIDVEPEELEGYDDNITSRNVPREPEDEPLKCSTKGCDNMIKEENMTGATLCRDCKNKLGIDLHANRSRIPYFSKYKRSR